MASTPKRTSTSKPQSASKDAAFSTATATPETPEQAAKVLVSTAIPVAGAELPLTKAQLEGKYRQLAIAICGDSGLRIPQRWRRFSREEARALVHAWNTRVRTDTLLSLTGQPYLKPAPTRWSLYERQIGVLFGVIFVEASRHDFTGRDFPILDFDPRSIEAEEAEERKKAKEDAAARAERNRRLWELPLAAESVPY